MGAAPDADAESNVSRTGPPDDERELLDTFRPFEPSDPPATERSCARCGWRGVVYRGRYGGHRCAVCVGLQHGWMPSGAPGPA